MNFIENMETQENFKQTENGAVALKSTTSHVLDLFALGGAMRGRSQTDIIQLFSKAYAENKLQALKVAFHLRDILEGQGERDFGRTILHYLADHDTRTMVKNMKLITEFGRWDDLYALVGTRLEKDMFSFIKRQINEDLKSEHPSLMAKWLKSENASALETKKLGKKTRLALGMSPKQYRLTLSTLRTRIGIIETKITNGEYDFDYDAIPGGAGLKYRNAFYRNDEERYSAFVNAIVEAPREDIVTKAVQTFKAKTLYPYEIIRKVRNGNLAYNEIQELEAYWRSLPDYLAGKEVNALVMVDTSGSMTWGSDNNVKPMDVAISLGMYFAERNTGQFKDYFMTFSNQPTLQKVIGADILDKVRNLECAHWQGNTNLEAGLELILNTAVKNNLPQEDIPAKLIIVSDMEFDGCVYGNNYNDKLTFLKKMKVRFAEQGYTMPSIVFWNVEARNNTVHAGKNERDVQLVSGMSANTFVNLIKSVATTPYELMLEVINSERYAVVKI